MESPLIKFVIVIANWLRRLGCNILANKISSWLYNRIDIDKMVGEVYADCKERLSEKIPDFEKKWSWMQKEHLEFLFGRKTLGELQPETNALVREFEEMMAKKHYVGMMAIEAYKADNRDDKITGMLNEVLRQLNIPEGDAVVTFADGHVEMDIAPQYKRIIYKKKRPELNKIEPHKPTQEEIAASAIKGSMLELTLQQAAYERLVNPPVPVGECYLVYGSRNESYVPVEFWVGNTGDVLVPNCDVIITCPEGVTAILDNEEMKMKKLDYPNGIAITGENMIHLNVGDLKRKRSKHFKPVYIKVPHDMTEVTLEWDLSSNTIAKPGKLKLINHPVYKEHVVYSDEDEIKDCEVADYIVDITSKDIKEE